MRNTQYPENWEKIKLGEVMTVIRGASPRPKGDPRYFGGSIPWVKISDITKVPGKYIYETKDHVTEAGAEKSRLLKKGSLILSNSGTVCVPKFLGVDGCIHDGFVSFPDIPEEIHKDFLLEYFNWIRPYVINENRQGITQVNLNTGIVRDFDLPIPPLPEQHRIVAAIENYFSRLDKAVQALERVKANLKRYRASVLKAAVEGRLVPTEAELAKAEGRDYEPASVLLERIKSKRTHWLKESVSQGDSEAKRAVSKLKKHTPRNSDEFKTPSGWTWDSFLNFSKFLVDCHNKTAPYTDSGIPLVRTSNIKNGKLISEGMKFVNQKTYDYWSKRCPPEPGDILFTREAPIGEATIIPDGMKVCMGQRMMLSRLFPDLMNTKYVLYAIQSPVFQHEVLGGGIGSGVQHLRVGDVESAVIPIPPLAEQNRIVVELEKHISVIDNFEKMVESNLQRTTRLRQAILKWAFEGKMADQDPNDEPASELLERIRLEREGMKPVKKTRKRVKRGKNK